MDLSFVTYNIHKGIGNDRLYRLQRIIDICRDLDADFIALQEVAHQTPRSKYEDMAKRLSDELGMFYKLGLNVKLKRGGYGNTTFSKYPITDASNMDITWAKKKKRGCLITLVQLPNQHKNPKSELAILNMHLGLAGLERKKQIAKILNSQFLRRHKDLPIVLLGDSNDRKDKLGGLMNDAGFTDTCNKPRMQTFPAFTPVWRLDKIYINHGLVLQEHSVIKNKQTRMASDHLPVLARVRIETDSITGPVSAMMHKD